MERAELNVCAPMVQGFSYAEGYNLFKERIRRLQEAADGMKARARDGMMWLDGLMDGRDRLAGERVIDRPLTPSRAPLCRSCLSA